MCSGRLEEVKGIEYERSFYEGDNRNAIRIAETINLNLKWGGCGAPDRPAVMNRSDVSHGATAQHVPFASPLKYTIHTMPYYLCETNRLSLGDMHKLRER